LYSELLDTLDQAELLCLCRLHLQTRLQSGEENIQLKEHLEDIEKYLELLAEMKRQEPKWFHELNQVRRDMEKLEVAHDKLTANLELLDATRKKLHSKVTKVFEAIKQVGKPEIEPDIELIPYPYVLQQSSGSKPKRPVGSNPVI
jgi:Asp-tRNA(Asn)/Glu-tRNA(Gln) amidotransferase C subunit